MATIGLDSKGIPQHKENASNRNGGLTKANENKKYQVAMRPLPRQTGYGALTNILSALSRGSGESGTLQPNRLYHNNADGTFTKASTGSIATDLGHSGPCAWGDYDNDGFLDLFVANAFCLKNFLYHNNGNGTFTRITNGSFSRGCEMLSDERIALITQQFVSTINQNQKKKEQP